MTPSTAKRNPNGRETYEGSFLVVVVVVVVPGEAARRLIDWLMYVVLFVFYFVFSHFHFHYCMILAVAQFFHHNFSPEQTD